MSGVVTLACKVCGVPVRNATEGQAFQATNAVRFVVCHAHAPLVETGGAVVGRLVQKAVRTFLTKHAPVVIEAYDEVRADAAKGPP